MKSPYYPAGSWNERRLWLRRRAHQEHLREERRRANAHRLRLVRRALEKAGRKAARRA